MICVSELEFAYIRKERENITVYTLNIFKIPCFPKISHFQNYQILLMATPLYIEEEEGYRTLQRPLSVKIATGRAKATSKTFPAGTKFRRTAIEVKNKKLSIERPQVVDYYKFLEEYAFAKWVSQHHLQTLLKLRGHVYAEIVFEFYRNIEHIETGEEIFRTSVFGREYYFTPQYINAILNLRWVDSPKFRVKDDPDILAISPDYQVPVDFRSGEYKAGGFTLRARQAFELISRVILPKTSSATNCSKLDRAFCWALEFGRELN